MTGLGAQRNSQDTPPAIGDASPWGALVQSVRLDAEVQAVAARMGSGLWLAPEARRLMPFSMTSSHGPAWWASGAAAHAMQLMLGKRDLIDDCAAAARRIFSEQPGWLDVMAERGALPNLAQARRILELWERFDINGHPDLTAFARERDTGMVHGWIGEKLFVGIEPDGRAHS
jgi:hypothetical protein